MWARTWWRSGSSSASSPESMRPRTCSSAGLPIAWEETPASIGLLWDATSLFLYSLATTPLLLALVRVSHGIGSGLAGPSSMAPIADTSAPERKGRAMALYGMSLALAAVIGFGIAGPTVARFGYSVLFYVL